MELQDRFNRVLDYIEQHLDGKLDYGVITQLALCSEFQFQRMFSALTGVSLGEYIRRRRLTEAAFDLQRTGLKVVDAAVKYGYESPDAFTRAFRRLHGATPMEVRQSGVPVASYPPLFFQITLKGSFKMDYRMEEIDFSPRFVGKKITVSSRGSFSEIPQLWANAARDGLQERLIRMSWEDPKCRLEGLVGIVGETSDIRDETFGYFMGARYDGPVPEDFTEIVLPSCLYAVFPAKEFSDAADIWRRIYSEWLPASGYRLADQPCVEHYLGPGAAAAFEVWLPVKSEKA